MFCVWFGRYCLQLIIVSVRCLRVIACWVCLFVLFCCCLFGVCLLGLLDFVVSLVVAFFCFSVCFWFVCLFGVSCYLAYCWMLLVCLVVLLFGICFCGLLVVLLVVLLFDLLWWCVGWCCWVVYVGWLRLRATTFACHFVLCFLGVFPWRLRLVGLGVCCYLVLAFVALTLVFVFLLVTSCCLFGVCCGVLFAL